MGPSTPSLAVSTARAPSSTPPTTSPRSLRPQHDPKRSDTLPGFLLELSGLSGRIVRTHAYGKTRPLAFSDVARLFVVDEETVISERSPILSGQHKDRLVERRAFRLLRSPVSTTPASLPWNKPEAARGRRAGRTEVLEELAAGVRAELERLSAKGSVQEAERRGEVGDACRVRRW